MIASDQAGRGPRPGEDPTEFDWPDDAKELRQAEREADRKRAAVNPAPRVLVAYLLGTWTVLAFIGVISSFQGGLDLLIGLAAPVALVGFVAALPLGLILERLTRDRGYGIPTVAFLVVGGLVGYAWTFAVVSWMRPAIEAYWVAGGASYDAGYAAQFTGLRQVASTFMLTAVATGFVLARTYTDRVRHFPKVVYFAAAVFGVLVLFSAIVAIADLGSS